MTARDEAIEAAERALFDQEAGVGAGGTAWWQSSTLAVETVAAALVPVLLNDLADRIATGGSDKLHTWGWNDATKRAAEVVRAAAEGWGA